MVEKEIISNRAYWLRFSIYVFIFTLVSLFHFGYYVYYSNQSIQIPLVHILNNPNLYKGDPFVQTLQYYCSTFWYMVAFFTRYLGLEPTLLFLYFICKLMTVLSAGYLASVISSKKELAVVSTMALFSIGIRPFIGGGEISTIYCEHTSFSIPFYLLAFAMFLTHRPYLTTVFASIGFHFNIMYGVYFFSYIGIIFLFDKEYYKKWKQWIYAFLLFLILSSPIIVAMFKTIHQKAEDKILWYNAMIVTFPFHFVPLFWDRSSWLHFIVFIIMTLVIPLRFLYQDRIRRYAIMWTLICGLWIVYAFLSAYLIKSPFMLQMHPLRGCDLWYCLAVIIIISGVVKAIEKSKEHSIIPIVALFCFIFFWNPQYISNISKELLLIVLIFLIYEKHLMKLLEKRVQVILISIIIILIFSLTFQRALMRLCYQHHLIFMPYQTELKEAAMWANQNTLESDIFLIPPAWEENFRELAQSSVFVTWKDGSAILWDKSFVSEWVKRLEALGYDIFKEKAKNTELEYIKKIYNLAFIYYSLPDSKLLDLSRDWNINYALVDVRKATNLPVVFSNKKYKILKLKAG